MSSFSVVIYEYYVNLYETSYIFYSKNVTELSFLCDALLIKMTITVICRYLVDYDPILPLWQILLIVAIQVCLIIYVQYVYYNHDDDDENDDENEDDKYDDDNDDDKFDDDDDDHHHHHHHENEDDKYDNDDDDNFYG